MSIETLLAYALIVIGFLLSLLIGLVVYVFVSLRQEVHKVAGKMDDLSARQAKLVHRDDFRDTTSRMHERLDAHDEELQALSTRVTRLEVNLESKT